MSDNLIPTVTVSKREFRLPFAALLPQSEGEEFDLLREDIRENGVQVAIILDELFNVLDGHNRLRAVAQLEAEGLEIPLLIDIRPGLSQDQKRDLAYRLNLHRRHLTTEQRRAVVQKLRAKERWSTPKIAEAVGVSHATVLEDLKTVQGVNSDTLNTVGGSDGKQYPSTRPEPEQVAARVERVQARQAEGATVREIAREEKVAVGTVARDLKSPIVRVETREPRFMPVVRVDSPREASRATSLIEKASAPVLGRTPDLRDLNRQVRQEQRATLAAELVTAPLPSLEGPYELIVADPPWRYEHIKRDSDHIENHYPTMDLAEICALPVASQRAAENCVLYLWTTSPKLEESFQVLAAWGFRYRTCMVWVKDKIGMGYWARQQHELILIATKGSPPLPEPEVRPSSVVNGDRTQHSAKPPGFYDLINKMFPGRSKMEMFARSPREGWAVWGNQAS